MDLLITLLLFVPIIALIVVANLGERSQGWRIGAYVGMALLGLAMALFGLLSLLLAALSVLAPPSSDISMELPIQDLVRTGLVLGGGALLSWVILVPAVRRMLARIIPIRADSVVNALALELAIILVTFSILTGGAGPEALAELNVQLSPLQVVLSEVPLAIMGLLGAGLLVRRLPADTWERLGLKGLTWRQLGWTLLGLVGLLAFEMAMDAVARIVAPQALEELSQATDQLYAGLKYPLAALVVAVASGTAEEILFRGAIQPRFGLVLTTFIFAISHTQYGYVWALLNIGVVGLVLGIYRQRINTTSCALLHGLYNLTLFLLAGLGQ